MSSILTNSSAMIALQTLRNTSANLEQTQQRIATGYAIGSARDNAAVWSISKVMESDVMGFTGISDSLSLGSSTIAVARSAAEQVTNLLTEMKQKIVSSQEENVDRGKIQQDVVALRDQISSIVGAAQFNGLNLLSNRKGGATATQITGNTGAGAGIMDSSKVSMMSSLDRSETGAVKPSSIEVSRGDLGTQAAKAGTGTELAAAAMTGMGAVAAGASGTLKVVGETTTAARDGNHVLAGDGYEITGLTGITNKILYVARDGDTQNDIATALVNRINFEAQAKGLRYTAELDGVDGVKITNNTDTSITTAVTLSSGGTAGGGLEILGKLDVSTEEGANAALAAIEGLSQTAIKAAADFGTAQKRVDIQNDFVKALRFSLEEGIGSLVDADMEEESARLQAYQVQQQLAIQALSIANQAPQNIIALFR